MKKPLTKTQQIADDKKKARHKKMIQDINKAGKEYFLVRALRDGDLPFTYTGYVNVILYSEGEDYISKNYGSMGNIVLKTNARHATSSHVGFGPLSERTIRRIFDDHETVLTIRGVALHLIP